MSNFKRKMSIFLSSIVALSSMSHIAFAVPNKTENSSVSKTLMVSSAVALTSYLTYIKMKEGYFIYKKFQNESEKKYEKKSVEQARTENSARSLVTEEKKPWIPDSGDYRSDFQKALEKYLESGEPVPCKYNKQLTELCHFCEHVMKKSLKRWKEFSGRPELINRDEKIFLVDLVLTFIAYTGRNGKEKSMNEMKRNKNFERIARIFSGFDSKEEISNLKPLDDQQFDEEIEQARKWKANVKLDFFRYDWKEMSKNIEETEIHGKKLEGIGYNLFWDSYKGKEYNGVNMSIFVKFLNSYLEGRISYDELTNEVKFNDLGELKSKN